MGDEAAASSARLAAQFETMVGELRILAESSRTSGQAAFEALGQRIAAAAAGFEATAARVADTLNSAASQTGSSLGRGAEEAVQRIADATEGMRTQLDAMVSELRASVAAAGESVRDGARLGGEDLRSLHGEALRRARRGLQIVFQDPFASLDPRQKVGDAVARGPMAYGTPRREAMAAARTLLERVGLTAAAAERYPHEFSGGQRQRICIARALVLRPQVLIADEAVSALDVSVQAQVLALLAELRREMRLAMIFITHDLRIAAEIADRVIVLQKGRIVEEGTTRDVFSAPREAYTRALLDAIPGRRFFEHPGFAREPVAPEVA